MTTTPAETAVPVFNELLNRYELDQRLTIIKRANTILGVVALLGFGGDLGYIFLRANPTGLIPVPAIVASFVAILTYLCTLIIAYTAAQRRSIGIASYLTVLGCALLVVGIQLIWIMVAHNSGKAVGLDDQSWQLFMAYAVPIALAVVVGDNILLYATVILLNAISVAVLVTAFLGTGQDLSTRHQFAGLLLTAVMTEWAIAIIVLAMRTGFRRIIFDATRLQFAVERARKLDDLKDQFISSVNHELRNPVMAMRGYLDALIRLDAAMPPELRQRFIAQALSSCQHVQDLIESILGVRRIDQGLADLNLESVDVHEVVTTAASLIDPREAQSGERPIHLRIPQGLTVWADRVRLQQVLTNLLSNAIKYSAPGTTIEVAAQLVVHQETGTSRTRKALVPAMVEIAVTDHGLGIPPDQIPLLFQKFVRLPRDLRSSVIGNGLGLFACKEITKALKGEIWVESTGINGAGSTFFVCLPATQHDAALPLPVRAPELLAVG